MPRRSDHSRSEFIDLVASAAETLVADAGASRLSARAIARRIGYSPGSLYLAFDNIDDVILHVNARTLDRLHEYIAGPVAGQAPALDRLKRAARAYAAFVRDKPDLWRLCYGHGGLLSTLRRAPPGYDPTLFVTQPGRSPATRSTRRLSGWNLPPPVHRAFGAH